MFNNNKIGEIVKIDDETAKARLNDWPASYYDEKEAINRKLILDKALEAHLDTFEEDEARLELWNRRYKDAKDSSNENLYYDMFIRAYFNIRHIALRSGRLTSNAKRIKEIKSILKDIGYLTDDEKMYPYTKVMFDEIKHMGKYYIDLSLNDKMYTSVIWGFGTRKRSQIDKKIAKEFYEVTDLVSDQFDIREMMMIWNDALLDAFKEMIPNWKSVLETLSKEI